MRVRETPPRIMGLFFSRGANHAPSSRCLHFAQLDPPQTRARFFHTSSPIRCPAGVEANQKMWPGRTDSGSARSFHSRATRSTAFTEEHAVESILIDTEQRPTVIEQAVCDLAPCEQAAKNRNTLRR